MKNILISSSQINLSPDRLLISSLFSYVSFPFSLLFLSPFVFSVLSSLLVSSFPSTSFPFNFFSLFTHSFFSPRLSLPFLSFSLKMNALTIKFFIAQTNKDLNKSKRQYKKTRTSLCRQITLCVCGVFLKHNDTPVVRASGRELSYVLLSGILLCYLVTFTLVLRPTDIVCGIQR